MYPGIFCGDLSLIRREENVKLCKIQPTFSAFLSEMSCFSSTVMLSLRFLTMSAGDLWDLPKGKGMAEGYHEQPGS